MVTRLVVQLATEGRATGMEDNCAAIDDRHQLPQSGRTTCRTYSFNLKIISDGMFIPTNYFKYNAVPCLAFSKSIPPIRSVYLDPCSDRGISNNRLLQNKQSELR